ncbi:hypothetical protein FBZ93_116169 [Bradyrhizobium macuxiense]|uniref:Uncharacterized protein n=1 Tax=Bradyrhizobium macuxiense TaxID=1755647 RepID=A0A560L8F6_9BRAD|nr:hypothetical protein FBZ93_116169 [Bradyrhizobium macuxiense]
MMSTSPRLSIVRSVFLTPLTLKPVIDAAIFRMHPSALHRLRNGQASSSWADIVRFGQGV